MTARILWLEPPIDGDHKIGFDQVSLQVNPLSLLRSGDVFKRFRIVWIVAYDPAKRLLAFDARWMTRRKPTLDRGFQERLPLPKHHDNLQID